MLKLCWFSCQYNNGWIRDGFAGLVGCKDLNLCDHGFPKCDTNAPCDNTVGSYDCFYDNGYAGDGVEDGAKCSGIDACVAKTYDCDFNASFSNTIGSFTCSCNRCLTFNAISGEIRHYTKNVFKKTSNIIYIFVNLSV